MKINVITACAALALTVGSLLNAEEAAKTCSPEFARMKSLVGSWTGKTDIGQGPIVLSVQ